MGPLIFNWDCEASGTTSHRFSRQPARLLLLRERQTDRQRQRETRGGTKLRGTKVTIKNSSCTHPSSGERSGDIRSIYRDRGLLQPVSSKEYDAFPQAGKGTDWLHGSTNCSSSSRQAQSSCPPQRGAVDNFFFGSRRSRATHISRERLIGVFPNRLTCTFNSLLFIK